jgi:hypothetical protein
MPGMVLGEVLHGVGFTWLLSLPMWGVNVDGLAYPLHLPTACSCQLRGQSFLSGASLSHHAAVGGAPFWGVRCPRARIFDGVLTVWVPLLSNLA